MNNMPSSWLDELKAAYPKRSGPMRWPRVFLPVRRALMETTWEDLIAGVHRYAAYIQASGKDGSDFVTTPENFFKDEIYLEELVFKLADDPKLVERRVQEANRRGAVEIDARTAGVGFDSRDSTAAIETRVMLSRQSPRNPGNYDLSKSVSSLADRMRMKG